MLYIVCVLYIPSYTAGELAWRYLAMLTLYITVLFQTARMGVGDVMELCTALLLGLATWALSALLYLLSWLRSAVFAGPMPGKTAVCGVA